jgi:GNAT superfamily N-acetyltransferase
MAAGEPLLRDASADDAPAIAAMVAGCFDTYRSFAPAGWQPPPLDPDGSNLVRGLAGVGARGRIALAEPPAAVAGFCAWTPARTKEEPRDPIPGLAHLWMLFVAPAHWGSGLAAQLLGWAQAGMAEVEYDCARLWTPTAHARARAFYERQGWRASRREEFSPELDLPVLEYVLDLPPA